MRLLACLFTALALACASGPAPVADPARYRLATSGADWTKAGRDALLADLEPRYPGYFRSVFDEPGQRDIDLRALREDLERDPLDRRNYDALNALAIGYFELNARAERLRGSGDSAYLGGSMQVAKLAAVPWRAYREIHDASLRDAILDFFADAARGEKPGSASTNARLAAIVESLEKRETNAARRERIRRIATRLAGDRGP